ncbi:MAG: hypothetical protein ACYTGX_02670 [Planctomycetota bacterium]
MSGRWGASALKSAGRAASIVALAGLAALAGCTNRSDKIFPVVQGPALQAPYAPNFGAAQAIDPTPSTSPSATVFDPSRHVAIASSGDGLIIFKADDGTGVIRLYAVRHLAGQGVTSPFTTPVVIDAGVGTSVDSAQLALDSNGDGVIVFSQPFQGIRRAYARIFNGATGQFQSPVSIDTGGSNTLSEDVTSVAGAALANGDILLAFSEADDVFAVKYTKASGTFSTPFQVDSLGNVGNTVTALRAQARGNAGQLSWLQDSDTSGGVNRVLFVSRHSTSGSLSMAATINPSTATDVPAYATTILSNGTVAAAWTQVQSGGGTRVFGRTLSASGSLNTAADLGGTIADTFAEPVIAADPRATVPAATVALRRVPASGTAQLYINRLTSGTFASGPSRADDTSLGAVASGSVHVAVAADGAGEIAFVQAQSTAVTAHSRVMVSRHSTSGSLSMARTADHGAAQIAALVASPLAFAAPQVTGLQFGPDGRSFVTFTQSDGYLTRAYVAASVAGQPGVFGAVALMDGASHNNPFAATAITDSVAAASATFLMNSTGTTGLSVMLQDRSVAATTNTRLWANTWSGFNTPVFRGHGTVLEDGFRDVVGVRDTAEADTALDRSGAGLAVFTQSDGTNVELYAAAIAGASGSTAAPSATSIDNGTTGTPTSPRVIIDPATTGGDAFVLFRQDDGSGVTQLYARRYTRSTGLISNVGTSATPAANEPIANTAAGFGNVVSYDAVFHPQDGSVYVVLRQVKTGGGAEGVFAVKVAADGTITGPVEFSNPSATVVGDPQIALDGNGNAMTLFGQGSPMILMSRHSTSSSLGKAVSGNPLAVSASTTLATGAFTLMADGSNNFVTAFERTDTTASTPGTAILARRWLASTGQWEGSDAVKISSGAATTAAPVLNYGRPRLAVSANGDFVVIYRQTDDRPAIDTVNLVAVTYAASSATFGTPAVIDNGDGTVNNGLDVDATAFDLAIQPSSGQGVVAFIQDADASAVFKPRLYAVHFDLSALAASAPVFASTVSDLSEGGALATAVTGFDLALDAATGRGWIVFTEQNVGDTDSTVTLAFARSYDVTAPNGAAGNANIRVSRGMVQGTGGAGTGDEGEHVTAPRLALDGSGGVRVTYRITQDANGAAPGTNVRSRLFSHSIR